MRRISDEREARQFRGDCATIFGGMTMRAWTGAMVLMLTWAALPASILGQAEGYPEGRRQIGCFRGRPLPACKSFWIVEMQGSLCRWCLLSMPILSGTQYVLTQ